MMCHWEKLNTLILVNSLIYISKSVTLTPNSRKISRSVLIECNFFLGTFSGRYFCYGNVWIRNGDYFILLGLKVGIFLKPRRKEGRKVGCVYDDQLATCGIWVLRGGGVLSVEIFISKPNMYLRTEIKGSKKTTENFEWIGRRPR